MTPWIPMMVAGVSLLSSVNIVGLLSYEARRRRRIATYLALAVPGRDVGYSRLVGGSPPRAWWRRWVL